MGYNIKRNQSESIRKRNWRFITEIKYTKQKKTLYNKTPEIQKTNMNLTLAKQLQVLWFCVHSNRNNISLQLIHVRLKQTRFLKAAVETVMLLPYLGRGSSFIFPCVTKFPSAEYELLSVFTCYIFLLVIIGLIPAGSLLGLSHLISGNRENANHCKKGLKHWI